MSFAHETGHTHGTAPLGQRTCALSCSLPFWHSFNINASSIKQPPRPRCETPSKPSTEPHAATSRQGAQSPSPRITETFHISQNPRDVICLPSLIGADTATAISIAQWRALSPVAPPHDRIGAQLKTNATEAQILSAGYPLPDRRHGLPGSLYLKVNKLLCVDGCAFEILDPDNVSVQVQNIPECCEHAWFRRSTPHPSFSASTTVPQRPNLHLVMCPRKPSPVQRKTEQPAQATTTHSPPPCHPSQQGPEPNPKLAL